MIIVCKLSFSVEISLEIACVDLVFTAQTGIHVDVACCVTTYCHGFSRKCDGKIPEKLVLFESEGVWWLFPEQQFAFI